MGYGKKSDFTCGKFITPSPNQYEIKAEFDYKLFIIRIRI